MATPRKPPTCDPRACPECGEEFTPARNQSARVFCSKRCTNKAANRRRKERDIIKERKARERAPFARRHKPEKRRSPAQTLCAHYNDCLDKAVELDEDDLVCEGCELYVHRPIEATTYVGHGYEDATTGHRRLGRGWSGGRGRH